MTTVLETFFTALGGVLIFISLQHLVRDLMGPYQILFIIAGITLILFATKLRQKYEFIPKGVVRVTGGILLFIGIKPYIMLFITQYWWVIGIIGIIFVALDQEIAGLLNGQV